jgi:lipid-A-disaccharide synthase
MMLPGAEAPGYYRAPLRGGHFFVGSTASGKPRRFQNRLSGLKPVPSETNLCRYNGSLRILISAGEASGEMYGAELIEAMRRLDPAIEFFGAGGERMRAAGCDIVVDSKDLAVVGITEVVSHLPRIYGCFRRLIAEADKRKPELAIIIDAPSFNLRVARQMKRRGIPVVYYVCPQFWAWRQWRVRLLREYVDKTFVIFPFEEKFYRDRGVDARFIGHPLASLQKPQITREEYAARYGIDAAKPWITIMPGSRVTEVEKNLPEILKAVSGLGEEYEYVLPVAATIDRGVLVKALSSGAKAPSLEDGYGTTEVVPFPKSGAAGGTTEVVPSHETRNIHLVPESLPALGHSRGGIIASGTATVEAAMMGTPFVMVYRVTPLTYLIGKPRVKVPHFAMVNLIAGREVVPELVQQDFIAENVVANLKQVLTDGPAREKMLQGLAEVRQALQGEASDDLSPAERAAGIILQSFAQSNKERP